MVNLVIEPVPGFIAEPQKGSNLIRGDETLTQFNDKIAPWKNHGQ